MNLAICQQTGTSLHLVNCATNAEEPWRFLPRFSVVRLTRLQLGGWSSLGKGEREGNPVCSWGAAKWVGDLRWPPLSLLPSGACLLLWVALACICWHTFKHLNVRFLSCTVFRFFFRCTHRMGLVWSVAELRMGFKMSSELDCLLFTPEWLWLSPCSSWKKGDLYISTFSFDREPSNFPNRTSFPVILLDLFYWHLPGPVKPFQRLI